jgi:hypothetical protein
MVILASLLFIFCALTDRNPVIPSTSYPYGPGVLLLLSAFYIGIRRGEKQLTSSALFLFDGLVFIIQRCHCVMDENIYYLCYFK